MRRKTRRNRVVAGLAALSVALAPAAIGGGVADAAQNNGAGPVPAKCRPGQIKKETKRGVEKTYVCNKKGKWVEVLYITAQGSVAAQPALQVQGS
jgi:hypothetical protein